MDTPGGTGMLGHKLGPLPIVAWVGLAGGAVAIALAIKSKSKNSSTSSTSSTSGVNGAGIDMLAPSSAEAFGTLEQQQQDLTNTLSTLGASVDAGNAGQQGIADQLKALSDALAAGNLDLAGKIASGNAGVTQAVAGSTATLAANQAKLGAGLQQQILSGEDLAMSNATAAAAGASDPRVAQQQQAASSAFDNANSSLHSLATG